MALVKKKWQLVATLVDKGGKPATTRTWDYQGTDTAGDASALLADGALHLADLAAVTDCVVSKYEVKCVFVEDALTLPTADTAENNAHALITAPIAGIPNKSATIDIPGPKNAIFANPNAGAGHDDVLITNTDVQNYLNNFQATGGKFFVSDGETIIPTQASGRRTHSKSVKG